MLSFHSPLRVTVSPVWAEESRRRLGRKAFAAPLASTAAVSAAPNLTSYSYNRGAKERKRFTKTASSSSSSLDLVAPAHSNVIQESALVTSASNI